MLKKVNWSLCGWILVTAMAAAVAKTVFAAPAKTTATDVPTADLRVAGFKCDANGNVDTLLIVAKTTGEQILHWRNDNVCGTPA